MNTIFLGAILKKAAILGEKTSGISLFSYSQNLSMVLGRQLKYTFWTRQSTLFSKDASTYSKDPLSLIWFNGHRRDMSYQSYPNEGDPIAKPTAQ